MSFSDMGAAGRAEEQTTVEEPQATEAEPWNE